MYLGARQILAGTMTAGTLVTYLAFLAMLIAPVFQIVAIGTQLTEAINWTRAHPGKSSTRKLKDEDDGRSHFIERVNGEVIFENVDFSYEAGKQILFDVKLYRPNRGFTAV